MGLSLPSRISPGLQDRHAVRLLGLTRYYGSVCALSDFTLEMGAGEFVALLGPSGCGKTTALRALAGLERLNQGHILVGGQDITNLPSSQRDMGMVFQAYSLFPHMTALENVAFGLRLRRQASAERRRVAEHFLEIVGLADRAGRYPHQLSGGQQQRVALARALAIEPRVLLLDEPLSALDAKVRTQLRDEIRRIQLELGTTTLFVTHDQEEAMAVADRVAVMHSGRIEQIGTPSELYGKPQSLRVAEFVGLSNHIRCEVHDGMARLFGCHIPLLEGSVTKGEALVMIRPECLEVTAAASGSAHIVAVTFLGSISRLQIRLEDQTLIQAQITSAELTHFSPGRTVHLGIKPVPAFAIPVPAGHGHLS